MKGWGGLAAGLLLIAGLVWAGETAPPAISPTGDITFVDEGQGGEAVQSAECEVQNGLRTTENAETGTRKPERKEPANPFVSPGPNPNLNGAGEESGVRKDAVPGYVELSSGAKVPGRIFTTRAERVKIFNLEKEVYEYVPVPAVRKIETVIEWERMEKEWRFKEAGSPEKVYTGRSYPARKLAYRLTLVNGHTITGHILGQPLYLARPSRASPSRASGSSDGSNDEGKTDRFILHDRQKGPLDTTLEDLVYIRSVVLGQEAFEEAGRGNAERGLSTMLPVESLSFDPEALDGWVERGPP